jgi:hypothetical protein
LGNKSAPPQELKAPPFAKGGVGVGYFLWQSIKDYEYMRYSSKIFSERILPNVIL